MASFEGESAKVIDKFNGEKLQHLEVENGDGVYIYGPLGDCR